MTTSQSEKLEVSLIGSRFREKEEHVPIKKRRFLCSSPSPPPRTPSPRSEESERLAKSEPVSGQGFLRNPISKCQAEASVSAVDLGQVVSNQNIDGKESAKVNARTGGHEDRSGISILAAAACSTSLGDVEKGSGVESSERQTPLEVLTNHEAKEDHVNCAEISTEATFSLVITGPPENVASLGMNNSSPKGLLLENILESTCLQNTSAGGSQDLSTKDEGTFRTQRSYAREDRLHWDLNTLMDEWEIPFDCQHSSPINVADHQLDYANDGKQSDEKGNLEGNEFQKDSGVSNDDTGKAQLPDESISLAHETQDLNPEEHKSHACSDGNRAFTSQAKLLSSGIVNLPNLVMDFVKETKCLQNDEKLRSDVESLAFVPQKDAPEHCTSPIAGKHASSGHVNFRTKSGEILSSHIVAGEDISVDYSVPPNTDSLNSIYVYKENFNAASTIFDGAKSVDGCSSGTSSSIYQVGKPNVFTCSVASLDKAASEIGNFPNEDGGVANEVSGSCDYGNTSKDLASLTTGFSLRSVPLDDIKENANFESGDGVFLQSSPTDVEVPTSATFLDSQPMVAAGSKVRHCGVSSGHDTTDSDMKMRVDSEKIPSTSLEKSVVPPYNLSSSSKVTTLEEHLKGGSASDVSQGDPHLGGGVDKENEGQMDYDSQYEDGELRDSDIHTWEGHDGEDGETELLDYGSDSRDTNNLSFEKAQESKFQSSPRSSSRKKVTDAGSGRRSSGSRTEDVIRNNENPDKQNKLIESSEVVELKVKISGWDPMFESHKNSSDTRTRVRDESVLLSSTYNKKGGLEAEDTKTKAVMPRAHRRELSSRLERTTSHNVLRRRERLHAQGSSSNYVDYPNLRSDRESGTLKSLGRGRCSLQSHARDQGGDHWDDSFEDYRKRHRSPTYHGPTAFRRSRLEDVPLNVTNTKEGGGSSVVGRQTVTGSQIMHRHFRSGSPTDREEAFRVRLGFRPTRKKSPDRSVIIGKGRSVRYGARPDGGPRRRYYGGANDDCVEYSLDYSHSLARRRRSFSPSEQRGIPHARQSISKSPSRSRARSPIAWQSPRGRIGDGVSGNHRFKDRSRSNCRFDARMPRVRSPYLHSNFATDHVTSFASLPRSHGSPPPNSSWIGYKRRSSVVDRSPGRIGSREDRFDPPRKLKSNEYSRSVHPGRFSELNEVGRRAPRYEGDDDDDDDDDKPEYRYGLVHPARHYDVDGGAVKRFRLGDEDSITMEHDSSTRDATDSQERENTKAYCRETDSRISKLPRRSREERSFVYRRDGRDNANSKTFETQEGDEDAASRKSRPS